VITSDKSVFKGVIKMNDVAKKNEIKKLESKILIYTN